MVVINVLAVEQNIETRVPQCPEEAWEEGRVVPRLITWATLNSPLWLIREITTKLKIEASTLQLQAGKSSDKGV